MDAADSDPSSTFAAAVRAIIDGDAPTLRALLSEAPSLATDLGNPPYRATLLHYVAANGVEDEFQRTPPNAPEMARLLLDAGAVPDVRSHAYGDEVTPLQMLVSSWPPFERGVQEALIRVFVQGGANPNGPQHDATPLTTALVFGYTGAAETLVALGARHDNLFAAAGLGQLERVAAWFGNNGLPRADALDSYVPLKRRPQPHEPAAIIQEALQFAVTHGRIHVAEFLLDRGAAPNGRVVGHHCELPLLQALLVRSLGILPMLLERGADPKLLDGKRRMTAIEHATRFGPPAARTLLGIDLNTATPPET